MEEDNRAELSLKGGDKKMASAKFTLNQADIKRVARNALIFAAPALLLLLSDLTRAIPEWFNGVWLIVALYILNVVSDVLRKLLAGK